MEMIDDREELYHPKDLDDAYRNLIFNGIVKQAVKDYMNGTPRERATAKAFLESFPLGQEILRKERDIIQHGNIREKSDKHYTGTAKNSSGKHGEDS